MTTYTSQIQSESATLLVTILRASVIGWSATAALSDFFYTALKEIKISSVTRGFVPSPFIANMLAGRYLPRVFKTSSAPAGVMDFVHLAALSTLGAIVDERARWFNAKRLDPRQRTKSFSWTELTTGKTLAGSHVSSPLD